MLVKEVGHAFNHKDWIFEIKWDGYRAIAELADDTVKLYSRNGNSFNSGYPDIVAALTELKLNATVDGEIVVLNKQGIPDFQLLQNFEEGSPYPIYYYLFDLLALNSKSLLHLPLIERKAKLRSHLPENEVIKFSDHIEEKGQDLFELIATKNLEGIVAKNIYSNYLPGKRTGSWLKIKRHKTIDAIICGFTQAMGERKYFGALVLGIRQGKNIVYIGHTGTGFNADSLADIYGRLQPLIRRQSPFSRTIQTNTHVTWVKPELVCEVKYSKKTIEGMLRHPVFLKLRVDRSMEDIMNQDTLKNAQVLDAENSSPGDKRIFVYGSHKVAISHWDKLFWPEEKVTKGDVVDYYRQVSGLILPYLKNRPQSLKRNPNGIADQGFYHKDAGEKVPDYVKTYPVHSESSHKTIDYIICNNTATLTYLNNLGCIELNPWHSTIQALDNPDYLIIDIDPSPSNTFDKVIEVANVFHAILEKAGAANFCKTSGATGLHIYIPTKKKYTYQQLKDFAELLCILAHEQLPHITSMERSLSKRENKIYLDHLQNRQGQTIAAAYSLRPYPGATVSTPLEWMEVKPGLSPAQFTIFSIHARVQKMGDLFKGIRGTGININSCLKKLE